MDPDATLAEIRRHRDDILNDAHASLKAQCLAGAINQLDRWLSRGGTLPFDWQDGPERR